MQGLAAWLAVFAMTAVGLSQEAIAAAPAINIQMLEAASPEASASAITAGNLDAEFRAYDYRAARRSGGPFWLKLQAAVSDIPRGVPVLIVNKGRHLQSEPFRLGADGAVLLPQATQLPGFRGAHEAVYLLPDNFAAQQPLYVRIAPNGRGAEELDFSFATLDATLARGAKHARMIAFAFGALLAMSIAAFLIWLILADKLFILYTALFSLLALYLAYLSGQGFDWPVLSYALPLTSFAWNVPAALSGAVSCWFAREIADLQKFSPRVYRIFGWIGIAFVALAFSNLGKLAGFGPQIAALGNLMFLGLAIYMTVVVFLAWRRGSRAAGWFLIAWGLLQFSTIAITLSWLLFDQAGIELVLYLGLPLSIVCAAVLIALGVADRLREQRVALTDAERRAQTDPLTGVLNRRSLLERLDAACQRAKTRGLPIAVLFIDLDHFKSINDSHGHPAGDACLAAIIDPIQAELRQSDVIGRFGGEEFVVILSSADATAALPIAERIVARIAELRVDGFGAPIALTCSIGVAASDTLGVWGAHLIAQADSAVYAAKKLGRNQVQMAAAAA